MRHTPLAGEHGFWDYTTPGAGGMYPVSSVKAEPSMTITEMCGTPMPFTVGVFDADTPEVTGFAVAVFDELRALFPMAGGCQIQQEVNLSMLKAACPDWISVSYDPNYLKTRNRLGFMEMAVDEPRHAGLAAHYLPRGVMPWGAGWPLELSLEQFWDAEIADILRFRPDGAWWFGSGTGAVAEGAHVSLARLRASGYADGRAARRALIARIERRG